MSYRREDSPYAARLIRERLSRKLRRRAVVLDNTDISAGDDFVHQLANVMGTGHVLVAIIGPSWLGSEDHHGEPRLHRPDDPVHVEIKTALDRGLTVIPVPLDETPNPSAAYLPADLASLTRYHAVRVRYDSFDADCDTLASALRSKTRSPAVLGIPARGWAVAFAATLVIALVVVLSLSIIPGTKRPDRPVSSTASQANPAVMTSGSSAVSRASLTVSGELRDIELPTA